MIAKIETKEFAELDRFCFAMLSILLEIDDVGSGRIAYKDSHLQHAPHTIDDLTSDKWDQIFYQETGVYPAPCFVDRGS